MKNKDQKHIEVWADWDILSSCQLMGILTANPGREKEIFSFEYDPSWLKNPKSLVLDPSLKLFSGKQFVPENLKNFGTFLDSAPDRWGRTLIQRKEALSAKKEKRPELRLFESDYLLGVYDAHRMGGLRFKFKDGPFLDNHKHDTTPPWIKLRELEAISLKLEEANIEKNPQYSEWLQMLFVPGSSLGGARPKASVTDPNNHLWIAKFPSCSDDHDVGGWEYIVHELAKNSGASYLEMINLLIELGSKPNADLEELWKRIVFYVCVSNTDDHLRNHAFLLSQEGWILSPAYDMNPNEFDSGLCLNISETSNDLDLELVLEVSEAFRVKKERAKALIQKIKKEVSQWQTLAKQLGIPEREQDRKAKAFEKAI